MVPSRRDTHFNSVHLQLTCNQQDKTPESTSLLSVLSLTHSTLVPNPFTKDLDTLTLNESRTEHIRKGDDDDCFYYYKKLFSTLD